MHKVSVIMPTRRPDMLAKAIAGFERQTYENKELLIIHDEPKVPESNALIHHLGLYEKRKHSIGEKRNIGCSFANGEIIVHMDDDDQYHSKWIEKSVEALITREADLTGLDSLYFLQNDPIQAYQYTYAGGQPYAVGASMCYWRRVWERTPFPEISEGEDAIFCGNAGKVRPHSFIGGMVAILHGNNTASHKAINSFKTVDLSIVSNILSTFE